VINICFDDNKKWESKMKYQIEYFKSILDAIKNKWIGVLAVTIICAMALGGFGFVKAKNTKNYVEANQREVEEYETRKAELDASVQDIEEYIQVLEDEIDNFQRYLDESIIMSLNGDEIHVANVQWNVISEYEKKEEILSALKQYVLEGGLKESLQGADDDLKVQYWNEAMTVTVDNIVFSVSIMQPSEELSKKSIDLIVEDIAKQAKVLADVYGDIHMDNEQVSIYVKSDAGIVKTQNSNLDTLKSYKNNHSDQCNKLSSLQDKVKSFEEENAPEVLEDISSSATKNAIKFAVIGVVIGLVIGIAVVIIDYCMSGRLRIAEDVKKYGLTLLTKRSKGNMVPEVKRTCMDILQHLSTFGCESTSIYCLTARDSAIEIAKEFTGCLIEKHVATSIVSNADTDAEAMNTLISNKTVCLVLSVSETETKRIEETIAMCKQYGLTIIGCIVA